MSFFPITPQFERLRRLDEPDSFRAAHSRRDVIAAEDAYTQMVRRGAWYRLWARLRRDPYTLWSLPALAAHWSVGARQALGVHLVPLAAIRGSEGKDRDFDRRFHPLRRQSRQRWTGIALARNRGQSLPPVELIQVNDGCKPVYFVRDGHHRISVARAYGQQEIEADVIAWRLRHPAPWSVPAAAIKGGNQAIVAAGGACV